MFARAGTAAGETAARGDDDTEEPRQQARHRSPALHPQDHQLPRALPRRHEEEDESARTHEVSSKNVR